MCRAILVSATISIGAYAMLFGSAASAWAQNSAPLTDQTRKALDFFGGHSAYRTLSQMPRRSAIRPTTAGEMPHNGKPFQSASSGPTISPYLNLFRDEREENEVVPSYYAFVRPQLEQQTAFQQQQREIQQLQRRLQGAPQDRAATVPGTGTQARFMDTAQFYGGWQR